MNDTKSRKQIFFRHIFIPGAGALLDENASFFIESTGVVFERLNVKGLFRVEQRSATHLQCSPAVWLSIGRRIT